jgi:hypothetical protein
VTAASGINDEAPVVSSHEIDVDGSPKVVWEVLTDFEPKWNPDVKSMLAPIDVAGGSEFRWKAGPSTITSRIRRVGPPRLIAWTGGTLGINAIHYWWLEPRDGTTFVRTAESYDGLVARLFRRPLQRALDYALANGLEYLKAEVERRRRRGPGRSS